MPNLKTHRRLTTVLALLSAGTFPFFSDPVTFVAFEAGILVTLRGEFTPDLDINTRRMGKAAEFMGLRAYSRLVPHRYGMQSRHWQEALGPTSRIVRKKERWYDKIMHPRSWTRLKIWNIFFFSHIPFLGTSLRTFLLVLPGFLLLLVLQAWSNALMFYLTALWVGMSLSDCVHVAADILGSDFKEFKREWWQQRRIFGPKPEGWAKKRRGE